MELDRLLVERGVRRAYELGRLGDAVVGALPIALLGAVAVGLGPARWFGALVGLALVLTVVLCLWRGLLLGAAVVPGVLAGMVPLVLVHLANHASPGCAVSGCGAYCVEACVAGGLAAGLLVVRFARRRSRPVAAWGVAGLLALLTGGLGCTCVGYTGALAMVGALFAASAPSLVVWAYRPA